MQVRTYTIEKNQTLQIPIPLGLYEIAASGFVKLITKDNSDHTLRINFVSKFQQGIVQGGKGRILEMKNLEYLAFDVYVNE